MKICDYLPLEHIRLDIALADKNEVLRFTAEACRDNHLVADTDMLYRGLLEREKTLSTGIGGGLCFPHSTSPDIKEPAVFLFRLARPVDFDALDNLPVDIVMAIVVPEQRTCLHLQILARVSRLCRKSGFIQKVREARDPAGLRAAIEVLEQDIDFQ